jgi:hypothetical protein
LAATAFLSWTLLPFGIPPFGPFAADQALEVLLWQAFASIGWPLAMFGALASTALGSGLSSLPAVFLLLPYPTMLMLVSHVLAAKLPAPWALPVLHLLLAFSFAAVWYGVRHGYVFMEG